MGYGFYLKKNRRKFRKVKVQSATPIKSVYKYGNPKAIIRRPKATSFAKRVNQIISRNTENKFTSTITVNNPVAVLSSEQLNFFVWTPGADTTNHRLFNLPVGTSEGNRIGNTIKLKRWIIKGLIQPKYENSTSAPLDPTNVGYVDIYFGKYLKTNAPISTTLSGLYQNGATTATPTCKSTDMLNPLNKDLYKVYYHKRFKMGLASDSYSYANNTSGQPNLVHPANNDFKVSQTFGFDVCKYILKNKSLKYNDGGITSPYEPPQNVETENLSVWATFTPIQGAVNLTGSDAFSLWHIDCLSYAEYEDA